AGTPATTHTTAPRPSPHPAEPPTPANADPSSPRHNRSPTTHRSDERSRTTPNGTPNSSDMRCPAAALADDRHAVGIERQTNLIAGADRRRHRRHGLHGGHTRNGLGHVDRDPGVVAAPRARHHLTVHRVADTAVAGHAQRVGT